MSNMHFFSFFIHGHLNRNIHRSNNAHYIGNDFVLDFSNSSVFNILPAACEVRFISNLTLERISWGLFSDVWSLDPGWLLLDTWAWWLLNSQTAKVSSQATVCVSTMSKRFNDSIFRWRLLVSIGERVRTRPTSVRLLHSYNRTPHSRYLPTFSRFPQQIRWLILFSDSCILCKLFISEKFHEWNRFSLATHQCSLSSSISVRYTLYIFLRVLIIFSTLRIVSDRGFALLHVVHHPGKRSI